MCQTTLPDIDIANRCPMKLLLAEQAKDHTEYKCGDVLGGTLELLGSCLLSYDITVHFEGTSHHMLAQVKVVTAS